MAAFQRLLARFGFSIWMRGRGGRPGQGQNRRGPHARLTRLSPPLGHYLGFAPLPGLYWPLLLLTLACYAALTQGVKMWLIRRAWI